MATSRYNCRSYEHFDVDYDFNPAVLGALEKISCSVLAFPKFPEISGGVSKPPTTKTTNDPALKRSPRSIAYHRNGATLQT